MRYRVRYRLGGRESTPRYAGSFCTAREAKIRAQWIAGELAAMRVPDVQALVEPLTAPLLKDVAARWQASRVDVRQSTLIQHRTALGRVLPLLGDRPLDSLTSSDVADLVGRLAGEGKARETIRKSVTVLAMVFDYAGIVPNPARDRVQVRLPREEPEAMEPPSAEHVEAVGWVLAPDYLIGLLVLDATGVRVGELEAARVGDLDESRQAWLVRASVSKTRRARWVVLPNDLYNTTIDRLPAREDRVPSAPLFRGVTADRLRMAIQRACRDTGTPHFAPHALRHRRISLMHRSGESWAEIGALVGQRSQLVTADTYSHALIDYREIDRAKLLVRVRNVHTPVHPRKEKNPALAGTF
ncbi:MAG: tyrosine-type recombinase/integrase [Gaiella sp.]